MKKIAIFALIVILTISMCAFALTACEADENKISLIEVTHSVFYAPLYIAIESGYFVDEGLNVELTNGGGADKCMTALLSGQANIGLMGPKASLYLDISLGT